MLLLDLSGLKWVELINEQVIELPNVTWVEWAKVLKSES